MFDDVERVLSIEVEVGNENVDDVVAAVGRICSGECGGVRRPTELETSQETGEKKKKKLKSLKVSKFETLCTSRIDPSEQKLKIFIPVFLPWSELILLRCSVRVVEEEGAIRITSMKDLWR